MVRCELKPASITRDNRGRLDIPVSSELAANPPPSCTQESLTIPPEAGANFRQELLFGSEEWKTEPKAPAPPADRTHYSMATREAEDRQHARSRSTFDGLSRRRAPVTRSTS